MLSVSSEVIILAAVRDEIISMIIHAQTHQLKEDTQSQFTGHEHRTDNQAHTSHEMLLLSRIAALDSLQILAKFCQIYS